MADRYIGTRDVALVEFLMAQGIVWDKWRMESVGRERFWFRNTAALRGAISQYGPDDTPICPLVAPSKLQ